MRKRSEWNHFLSSTLTPFLPPRLLVRTFSRRRHRGGRQPSERGGVLRLPAAVRADGGDPTPYALTPPDPQLKGAWYPGGFNPCTHLKRKLGFKVCLSMGQRVPLHRGRQPGPGAGAPRARAGTQGGGYTF
jgi:hypothetical protein